MASTPVSSRYRRTVRRSSSRKWRSSPPAAASWPERPAQLRAGREWLPQYFRASYEGTPGLIVDLLQPGIGNPAVILVAQYGVFHEVQLSGGGIQSHARCPKSHSTDAMRARRHFPAIVGSAMRGDLCIVESNPARLPGIHRSAYDIDHGFVS